MHPNLPLETKMIFFLGRGPSHHHHTPHPSMPTVPRPLLTEILNTPLTIIMIQNIFILIHHMVVETHLHAFINKCIGDDTKAAAPQNLNCIKNNKAKYGEKRSRPTRYHIY